MESSKKLLSPSSNAWLILMFLVGVVSSWVGLALHQYNLLFNSSLVSKMFFIISLVTIIFLAMRAIVWFNNFSNPNRPRAVIAAMFAFVNVLSFVLTIVLYVVF